MCFASDMDHPFIDLMWQGQCGSNARIWESKSHALTTWLYPYMVADSGLEPERLTAPHFEGGVSSNSTNPAYEKPPEIPAVRMRDSAGSVSLTPFPASRTSCFLFALGSSKDLSPVSFTLAAAMALLTTPEMPTNLCVSLYFPPHSKKFSAA